MSLDLRQDRKEEENLGCVEGNVAHCARGQRKVALVKNSSETRQDGKL